MMTEIGRHNSISCLSQPQPERNELRWFVEKRDWMTFEHHWVIPHFGSGIQYVSMSSLIILVGWGASVKVHFTVFSWEILNINSVNAALNIICKLYVGHTKNKPSTPISKIVFLLVTQCPKIYTVATLVVYKAFQL